MTAIVIIAFFFLGVTVEKIRKTRDMRLDAENGVTWVGGVPHALKRYGPEQSYEE